MENGTARPNIVRFNVTVRHTATSNAAAYNVELTQGSSVFDVYWGDEALGPAPNDPRLTITGDRLMSWKENSLGESERDWGDYDFYLFFLFYFFFFSIYIYFFFQWLSYRLSAWLPSLDCWVRLRGRLISS